MHTNQKINLFIKYRFKKLYQKHLSEKLWFSQPGSIFSQQTKHLKSYW